MKNHWSIFISVIWVIEFLPTEIKCFKCYLNQSNLIANCQYDVHALHFCELVWNCLQKCLWECGKSVIILHNRMPTQVRKNLCDVRAAWQKILLDQQYYTDFWYWKSKHYEVWYQLTKRKYVAYRVCSILGRDWINLIDL